MKKISRISLLALLYVVLAQPVQAQLLRDYVNDAGKLLSGNKNKDKNSETVTYTEIVAGLREALQVGAQNATKSLSLKDGFFGNAMVKIMMPPEAKKVENTLRQIGMGSYVDKAILSMNRAAEDAAQQALPIFVNAIKGMSIQDAVTILNGPNNAATEYLKSKTTAQLTAAFRPVINRSLEKVNATKYWAELCEVYNSLPTTYNKVNPDLAGYVTQKALDGVFHHIADEETKIRLNPADRVTDLLKKVFSYKKK